MKRLCLAFLTVAFCLCLAPACNTSTDASTGGVPNTNTKPPPAVEKKQQGGKKVTLD
jgi:hypothetical protein